MSVTPLARGPSSYSRCDLDAARSNGRHQARDKQARRGMIPLEFRCRKEVSLVK